MYRFIRFFSQKLRICIALNDTFLSIADHLWYRGRWARESGYVKLLYVLALDFYVGKSITRITGRDGPWKSRLFWAQMDRIRLNECWVYYRAITVRNTVLKLLHLSVDRLNWYRTLIMVYITSMLTASAFLWEYQTRNCVDVDWRYHPPPPSCIGWGSFTIASIVASLWALIVTFQATCVFSHNCSLQRKYSIHELPTNEAEG